MGENVASLNRGIEVVIEIVDVHIAIAETASRGDVEVAYDLVDSDSSLNAASFLSLRVQSFSVMFPLALFDILASSKCPGNTGVCLSHFVASITATGFLSIRRRVCAVTPSTVIGVQVRSLVITVSKGCKQMTLYAQIGPPTSPAP